MKPIAGSRLYRQRVARLLAAPAMLTCLLPFPSATASPASTITITGSAQFWHRHCDAQLHCQLPQALTAKIPVSGEVSAPVAGQLAEFHLDRTDADLSFNLTVYWAQPSGGAKPYLAAQTELRRALDGLPLAQCSQYSTADVTAYFPVGACAGYVPEKSGGTEQFGVSFYPE